MDETKFYKFASTSIIWSSYDPDKYRFFTIGITAAVKMNINSIGIADLFNLLESNKLGEVEEIKKVFHELFLCSK